MPKYTTFICEVCLAIDPNTAVVQDPHDRRKLRISFVPMKNPRPVYERDVMTLCRKHQIAMAEFLDRTNREMTMSKKLAMLLIHAKDLLESEELPF